MQSHFVTVSSYIVCTGLEFLQWAHPTPVFGCAPLSPTTLMVGAHQPLGHPIPSQYQQDLPHTQFQGSLSTWKADIHKKFISSLQESWGTHTLCGSKVLRHNSPTRQGAHHEADLDLLSGGFFLQISTELIDFHPSRKLSSASQTLQKKTMQKVHFNSPWAPWDRGLHLQQVPHPARSNNFTPELAPSLSPEQARFAEECVHISSLQNHLPQHYTFSQGSCVGCKGLLHPAKSLWQPLFYFVAFYKKRWLLWGFFFLFFCFLSSANRNALHERLFTLMWLATVLRSKMPNYKHTITFSSLMRSKIKPGIQVKLQHFLKLKIDIEHSCEVCNFRAAKEIRFT